MRSHRSSNIHAHNMSLNTSYSSPVQLSPKPMKYPSLLHWVLIFLLATLMFHYEELPCDVERPSSFVCPYMVIYVTQLFRPPVEQESVGVPCSLNRASSATLVQSPPPPPTSLSLSAHPETITLHRNQTQNSRQSSREETTARCSSRARIQFQRDWDLFLSLLERFQKTGDWSGRNTCACSLMTDWRTAMTGKLADKIPITMSSLINTIPDSLYPEEDIPTSMNISQTRNLFALLADEYR